jgi:hypothetical protein
MQGDINIVTTGNVTLEDLGGGMYNQLMGMLLSGNLH